jgi:hypothetical protein
VVADTVNLLPLLPTLHLVFTLLSNQWRRKQVGGQKGYMEYSYIPIAGGDIHQLFANKVHEMFTDVQFHVKRVNT